MAETMITILMVYTVVMVLDMFNAGLQEIHWSGEVSMDRTALRIYVREGVNRGTRAGLSTQFLSDLT